MKKLFVLLIVLVMCLNLSACGTNENEEENNEPIGMKNPVVYYDSLDEINEMIDVQLLKPTLSTVENEMYSVIDNRIAQYTCSMDGFEWIFRAAHITNEDISGMNIEFNVFEEKQDSGLYVNEFYLDRFFDGDKQYTTVIKKSNQ